MQRTRRNDYWDTFSLYLENTEDPATKDKNLAQKLADNRTEGERRLAAVFEKYEKKEKELRDQINEETSEKEENEFEEINIINDKDEINHLSVTSENSDNEKNINKTVKENTLPIKKDKPCINMVNACHSVDKAISSKTIIDTLQEKCKNAVEIKVLTKEKNTAVSTNENKTVSKKMVYKSCSSNIILENVVKNVVITNTQEDSLPMASTANCTSSIYINRIEDI